MRFGAVKNVLGRRKGSRTKVSKKKKRGKGTVVKLKIKGSPAGVKKAVKNIVKTEDINDSFQG